MGKTELIVRRFVVCYTKLVAEWFVGAHTMEKAQQALVFLCCETSLQCHIKHDMTPMTLCKTFS